MRKHMMLWISFFQNILQKFPKISWILKYYCNNKNKDLGKTYSLKSKKTKAEKTDKKGIYRQKRPGVSYFRKTIPFNNIYRKGPALITVPISILELMVFITARSCFFPSSIPNRTSFPLPIRPNPPILSMRRASSAKN